MDSTPKRSPSRQTGQAVVERLPIRAVPVVLLLAALAGPALAGSYEDDLLRLINGYRTTQDLEPLAMRPALAALARRHSQTMRRAGRLSHDGFQARFRTARSNGATGCVENVGWNYPTARAQFDGWQQSPGHDRNMLDPAITGAGIARVGPYITFFACY
jgi:uncharacterized protein YkwD